MNNLRFTAALPLVQPNPKNLSSVPTETTLLVVKPEAFPDMPHILTRLTEEGFFPAVVKTTLLPEEKAKDLYGEHASRNFFKDLISYITSSPVAMVALRGSKENLERLRSDVIGATDSTKAKPGTIRHEYGINNQKNATHASEKPEAAQKELPKLFSPEELKQAEAFTIKKDPEDKQYWMFHDRALSLVQPHKK